MMRVLYVRARFRSTLWVCTMQRAMLLAIVGSISSISHLVAPSSASLAGTKKDESRVVTLGPILHSGKGSPAVMGWR